MNNRDYETTFIRIARDVILQAAGKYEAPVYWVAIIFSNPPFFFNFLKIIFDWLDSFWI